MIYVPLNGLVTKIKGTEIYVAIVFGQMINNMEIEVKRRMNRQYSPDNNN